MDTGIMLVLVNATVGSFCDVNKLVVLFFVKFNSLFFWSLKGVFESSLASFVRICVSQTSQYMITIKVDFCMVLQIHPDDAFGQQMLRNLEVANLPFQYGTYDNMVYSFLEESHAAEVHAYHDICNIAHIK